MLKKPNVYLVTQTRHALIAAYNLSEADDLAVDWFDDIATQPNFNIKQIKNPKEVPEDLREVYPYIQGHDTQPVAWYFRPATIPTTNDIKAIIKDVRLNNEGYTEIEDVCDLLEHFLNESNQKSKKKA
jgi:hypothetical protein